MVLQSAITVNESSSVETRIVVPSTRSWPETSVDTSARSAILTDDAVSSVAVSESSSEHP